MSNHTHIFFCKRILLVLLLGLLSCIQLSLGQDTIPKPPVPSENATEETEEIEKPITTTPEIEQEAVEEEEDDEPIEEETQPASSENTNVPQTPTEPSPSIIIPYVIETPTETIDDTDNNVAVVPVVEDNPFNLIRNGQPRSSNGKIALNPRPKLPISKEEKQQKKEEAEEIEAEETPKKVELPRVIDTSDAALSRLNPFQMTGKRPKKRKPQQKIIRFNPNAGTGVQSIKKKSKPIFKPPKVNSLGTLKFVFLLIILGFLAFLMTNFRPEINNIYKSFMSHNMLVLLHREKGNLRSLPYLLLYLLYCLTGGTFLFLVSKYMGMQFFENNFLSLLTNVGIVSGFYLVKHVVLALLSSIFPFSKEMNLYAFTIAVFNQTLGIILIPFIAFIAFDQSNVGTSILYISFIVISLVYLYRAVRALIIGRQYISFHKFHFFVYLCAVELAPLLIIIKLMGLG